MKKSTKEVKKLGLSRETLLELQDARLAEVVRGGCTGIECETSIGMTCCVHN